MSTSDGMWQEKPGPPGRGSWWSRIGTFGQALTALIGMAAAVVPIIHRYDAAVQNDSHDPAPSKAPATTMNCQNACTARSTDAPSGPGSLGDESP